MTRWWQLKHGRGIIFGVMQNWNVISIKIVESVFYRGFAVDVELCALCREYASGETARHIVIHKQRWRRTTNDIFYTLTSPHSRQP